MNEYYCLEHMRITGHRNMMEPLYVTCYACPQCLMLFNTKDDTLDHMHKESHKSYIYAFKGESTLVIATQFSGYIPTEARIFGKLSR